MPSVLILGGRAPAALDHARRFARSGWTVHVGDSVPCRLAGWSRSVAGTVALAPPRQAPARFAADLSRAIAAHRIDLVLPTCEEVFYLSRYRSALPAQVRVLADDFDTLARLHSKWHFLGLAQGCGANVPESARVRTIGEAREWAAGAPLVLKPEYSRFGVHVRIHPQGLPADAPALPPMGDWIAQRHHAGRELCSYAVADRGRLLANAVYRPSHRLRRSSSYYFAAEPTPAIDAFVAAFVLKLGFTGQVSFDWIIGEDGRATVIECNPRATSGLHLFAPGDDVPAAVAGTGSGMLQPDAARAAMIAPMMLTVGLASAIARGALPAWWRDWRRADDVMTAPGDSRPLPGALADLGSYARLALAQGCNLREAATRDIEWDGEPLPAP